MLWIFKQKRYSDGSPSKKRARIVVMGNLQENPKSETYSAVVAWSTVRLFLVLTMILGWETAGLDFTTAFLHSKLKEPIWCHIPRGFRSDKGPGMCLKLKRSVYGTKIAPKLWADHLAGVLRELGFKPSKYDPCLWYKSGMLMVLYVDDVALGFKDRSLFEQFKKDLKAKHLKFTEEAGSFSEFLGINITKDKDGTLVMTQKGLICKVLDAAGMTDCNPNWTPAPRDALGIDPDGEPYDETWDYASIVGMLIYLATNTRVDISYSVSQVARFTHNPKKSHAAAVKTILRYLKGTMDKGTIYKLQHNLDLELYVDADFAGGYKRDPDEDPISAKSRLGWIIFLAGCPVVWKSKIQQDISTSSAESEYSALSLALKMLIPLRYMLLEACDELGLPKDFKSSVACRAFEDNAAALQLATEQRITNRTRYYHVKWHWFWDKVICPDNPNGVVEILCVDTHH